METYKIEYLINELNKNNIKIMHINKLNEQEYNIVLPYNNNYIIIENKNSTCNYNENNEKTELLQMCCKIRDSKQQKRSYDDMIDEKYIISNNDDIQNIYIIRLNMNAYMTKKKKRYPCIFTINDKDEINVNTKEWEWRFNLLKTMINHITGNIDVKTTENIERNNYIIKLFYRHFSMDEIYNYNMI